MTPPAESRHEPPAALLAELAATAAATAGMSPSMLDRRIVRHTFRQRMKSTGAPTPGSYADLYRQSPAEQSAFLEGVLNGETSFFRDAVVFAELSRWCLAWFTRNTGPLRILSAPCSTGEEPYSIAAMLEAAGVPLDRFTLEALDLSSIALDHAQAAVYNGLSLRNIPQPGQCSFLEQAPKGWRVKKHLRDHVSFRHANLLDPEALAPHSYDLICSRNLLIYQTPEARRQMAASLAAALAPGGRLVLGAADWGRDLDEFFRLEEPVNSFALRLRNPDTPQLPNPVFNLQPASTSIHPQSIKTTAKIGENPALLAAADQLADVTELYRHALEAHLRTRQQEAERLCRQVLYLEPAHLPSLELLAKIHRPQASNRMTLALHARLKRHRIAAGGPQ